MCLKKLLGIILAGVVVSNIYITSFADGASNRVVSTDTTVGEIEISGEYGCVRETSTGRTVFEKNSEETFHMGHFAKLMTIYLTARQIESGEISLEDIVTVSQKANSQNGTQIWLNVGEKITIEELLKSICMGNANDACYCLSEALFKSEDTYLKVANETAVSLGLENTHFADITGQNDQSVTSVADLAVLAGEIAEFDYLNGYFCTWIDNVRGGQTELVNTNRLVRSYDGIIGMKACYDEDTKNSLVAAAKRDGMTFVCVAVGYGDSDERFSDGKKMLDFGFSRYVLYTPNVPKEAVKNIKVKKGAENDVKISVKNLKPLLVKKDSAKNITCAFEVEDSLTAPVKKGEKVGEIRFLIDDEVIFESEICTQKQVFKMNFGLAFKRLWLKLLNFGD